MCIMISRKNKCEGCRTVLEPVAGTKDWRRERQKSDSAPIPRPPKYTHSVTNLDTLVSNTLCHVRSHFSRGIHLMFAAFRATLVLFCLASVPAGSAYRVPAPSGTWPTDIHVSICHCIIPISYLNLIAKQGVRVYTYIPRMHHMNAFVSDDLTVQSEPKKEESLMIMTFKIEKRALHNHKRTRGNRSYTSVVSNDGTVQSLSTLTPCPPVGKNIDFCWVLTT